MTGMARTAPRDHAGSPPAARPPRVTRRRIALAVTAGGAVIAAGITGIASADDTPPPTRTTGTLYADANPGGFPEGCREPDCRYEDLGDRTRRIEYSTNPDGTQNSRATNLSDRSTYGYLDKDLNAGFPCLGGPHYKVFYEKAGISEVVGRLETVWKDSNGAILLTYSNGTYRNGSGVTIRSPRLPDTGNLTGVHQLQCTPGR